MKKLNYKQAALIEARAKAKETGLTHFVYRYVANIERGPNKGLPGRRASFAVSTASLNTVQYYYKYGTVFLVYTTYIPIAMFPKKEAKQYV